MKSDEKYHVGVFAGHSKDCELVGPELSFRPKRHHTFVKKPDGTVCVAGPRGPSDIRSAYRFNEAERRMWCKLAGVRFVDLKAAMKAQQEKEASETVQYELQRLRANAGRHGYRLVRDK